MHLALRMMGLLSLTEQSATCHTCCEKEIRTVDGNNTFLVYYNTYNKTSYNKEYY